MYKLTTAIAALALFTACGVSEGTPISELSESESISVCEDLAADFPSRTITCETAGTEFTIDVGVDEASCSNEDEEFQPAPASCTVTVGDQRDCLGAYYALTEEDICTGEFPTECDALFSEDCVSTDG